MACLAEEALATYCLAFEISSSILLNFSTTSFGLLLMEPELSKNVFVLSKLC